MVIRRVDRPGEIDNYRKGESVGIPDATEDLGHELLGWDRIRSMNVAAQGGKSAE